MPTTCWTIPTLVSSGPCKRHKKLYRGRTLSSRPSYCLCGTGILNLTGYTRDQVWGRSGRFLQGSETNPKAVEKIRRSIEEGTNMSVCLWNYRVDGSTFWNHFFVAALKDAYESITNYAGVPCKVSDQYAANVRKKQEEDDEAPLYKRLKYRMECSSYGRHKT